MGKVCRFFGDMVADGYKFVSVIAPILSILFVLAKAVEWPVKETLKELSYAWALLPITIWFLIAYIRRWNKSKSFERGRDQLRDIRDYKTAIDALSVLFDEGNNKIFNGYTVTNEIQYGSWHTTREGWAARVEAHLEESFGLSERNLFKNIVLFYQIKELGGISDEHNKERSILAHQLQTIREIIVRHSEKIKKCRTENI